MSFMAWLTDRKQPRRSVLFMGALGCALAGVSVLTYWWACRLTVIGGHNPLLCRVIAESPPWALLAGMVTLPGVTLGWYWRTDFKNHELDAAEEKSRAERFVKYAEMLGQDAGPSQLGGIHGLRHLGIEDPKRKDLVVDVLCSFVRNSAPRDYMMDEHSSGEPASAPSLAVATSIEALSSLRAIRADLRGVTLELLSADAVTLTNADFREAFLPEAVLQRADLSHCRFDLSNCGGADLTDSTLVGASFVRAHLWGTHFVRANLAEAVLSNAVMTSANLKEANLKGANLEGAKLDNANLQGADLRGARLRDADLQGADLRGAKLGEADLQGANLERADLEGAILWSAILDKARLAGTNVTREQLTNIQGWPIGAPFARVDDADDQ